MKKDLTDQEYFLTTFKDMLHKNSTNTVGRKFAWGIKQASIPESHISPNTALHIGISLFLSVSAGFLSFLSLSKARKYPSLQYFA